MAVTQNTYTGDGSTVLFSFTFPYLETTDIKVSLDGSITTAYTLANATTIQFNTAPGSGVAIRIYRQTDDENLSAQFYSGSAIRASDLNDNFTQNLYVTQESNREAAAAVVTADAATVTANTALSTAQTAESNSNSAVTTANTAETNSLSAISTANTASTDASTAVTTANTAVTTANSAVTTANSAVTTANNAVTTANSAVTTANTANTTANNAESIANSALDIVAGTIQFVPYADVASIPGSPSDQDAIQVVDSTGIESFTPLTGLPSGFVGTPQLFVRLQYDATGVTWTYVGYGANDPDNRYVIQGVIGSATNPSFYFDPNTGIYSPGEDELALSTGGSARLTIDSSGGVAIPGTLGVTGAITGSLTGAASLNVLKAGDTMTGNLTAPAFIPNGGTAPTNGLYLPAANSVALSTSGVQRINIEADGDINIDSGGVFYDATNDRLGIGTSSPSQALQVGSIATGSATTTPVAITLGSTFSDTAATPSKAKLRVFEDNSGAVYGLGVSSGLFEIYSGGSTVFYTNGATEACRIDSSQRLLVGTSNSTANARLNSKISVVGTGDNQLPGIMVNGYTGTTASAAPFIDLARSRGTTDGSYTEVVNNDTLGYIVFRGADGAGWSDAATITAHADGDWTTSGDTTDSPGRLVFSTTADGESSLTERMRISQNGTVGITGAQAGTGKLYVQNQAGTSTDICLFTDMDSGSNSANAFHHLAITQGVGGWGLTGNGTSTFSSDARKKKNIETTRDGYLEDLCKLRVVKYNWNIQEDGEPKELGIIAQEVEQVFPGLVTESIQMEGDDYKIKTVKGSVIQFMLLKALQEASAKIDALEAEVAALKAQ